VRLPAQGRDHDQLNEFGRIEIGDRTISVLPDPEASANPHPLAVPNKMRLPSGDQAGEPNGLSHNGGRATTLKSQEPLALATSIRSSVALEP
jgi:hypothetical protein